MPGSAEQRLVIVAGEALVDLVAASDGCLCPHPGGGPFTAARALARLGGEVSFLGSLSRDGFGERLASVLADDGVGLSLAPRTALPTTLALAELDGDGAASYGFYTYGTSAASLGTVDAEAALAARPAAVHAGTLGLVLEPIASVLAAMVAALDDDVFLLLDPNCRPALITDRAAYLERLRVLSARADLLKASTEDLEWLAPGCDPVATASDLIGGEGAAVITDGPRGAVVVPAGRPPFRVPAPTVDVVDTIGAGDTFGAALLADWLGRGLGRAATGDARALEAAARFACRAAAVTCSRAGAVPPRTCDLAC